MSQIIEIHVLPKEVRCEMKESLNSVNYYYNLNILDNDGKIESKMSEPFQNQFLNMAVDLDFKDKFITKPLAKNDFKNKNRDLKNQNDLERKNGFKIRQNNRNSRDNFNKKKDKNIFESISDSKFENSNLMSRKNEIFFEGSNSQFNNSNSKSFVNMSVFDKDKDKETGRELEMEKTDLQIEFPNIVKNPKTKNEFANGNLLRRYTLLKNRASTNRLENKIVKKVLEWRSKGPEIKYKINISDLSSLNLQICIWKERKNKKKLFLKSECYLYLQKFLNNPSQIIKEKNYIKKIIDFSGKIWLGGKNTGNLKAKFEMKYLFFFQQKVAGVMTENGLIKSSPLIYKRKSKNHPKLKILNSSYNDLNEHIYKLETTTNIEMKNYYKDLIKNEVTDIKKIFLLSDKISSKSFIYNSIKEIYKAQEIFLELGNLLLDSYSKLDDYMEEEFYACLRAILYRGELALSNLGFKKNNSNDDNKLRIGIQYQKFIYRLLGIVFDDIQQKGMNDFQRGFIETFLAISYFRIPEFRDELIFCLNNNKKMYMDKDNRENNEVYSVLLNWKQDFYDYLTKKKNEEKENRLELAEILKKPWKKKFENISNIYFYFIIEWNHYVEKTLVITNLNWSLIPGYRVLVQNFIEQMKRINIKRYPDVLIDASLALLKNPKVLNQFISTLISKTDLFLQKNVVTLFGYLSKFFDYFKTRKKNLPLNIDFYLLIYITILMLKTNHALAIAHALNFWYSNYEILPKKVKVNIFEIIVNYFFFKLFLHWSTNVREVFYFFIFYAVIKSRAFLKGELLEKLDNSLRKVNRFVCLINFIGNDYKKRIFLWEMKTKKEKRKISFRDNQELLLKEFSSKDIFKKILIKNELKINDLDLKKKNQIFDFNKTKLDFEITENFLKNDFFIFEKNKFTSLKSKNLVYCSTVMRKFFEIRDKFATNYKDIIREGYLIPMLKFQLPIDEFEYVDNEEDDDLW